jgi:hypothetical protein
MVLRYLVQKHDKIDGGVYFTWPSNKEESTEPRDILICVMSTPARVHKTRREERLFFEEGELNNLHLI